MQLGISRFRQRLRRAAAALSLPSTAHSIPEHSVSSTPLEKLVRENGPTSTSRNWMLNDELFVLHAESCVSAAMAGTIHVGHSLHQPVPLPRLESLRDSVAEAIRGVSASLRPDSKQGSPLRPPTPSGGTGSQTSPPLHWPENCSRLLAQAQGQFEVAAQNLLAASSHGLRTVAITGHIRGEGRSTVAMCLSRAVARLGGRTALCDGDTSTPDLVSQLGATGLPNRTSVEATPDPLVVGPAAEQVNVFFRSPYQLVSTNHVANPLASLVQTAAAKYDLVVVDLPPLDCTGRLPISCTHLDAAILVRNCHKTIPEDVCEAARSLRAMGMVAVGVAENFQVL